MSRSQRSIAINSLKDVMVFSRKVMTYIAETLYELANKLDDDR